MVVPFLRVHFYVVRQHISCAEPIEVNVISAAMPNLADPQVSAIYGGDCSSALWRQTVTLSIRAVLAVAVEEEVDVLILGAFGCGAFRNDARTVASIFKRLLMSFEFAGAFSDVIFAIVERDDARDGGNIAIFREVLSGGLRVVGT